MKFKTTPDFCFFACIGMSILFHSIMPIAAIIRYPYSYIGVLFIVSGILIVFRSNSVLLKKNTTIQPFENPSVFVTSGPFRYSRNPIYLSMAITLLGLAIFLGSLSPFISPILLVIIIDRTFIPLEENILEKQFQRPYLDYKAKVNRWF